MRCGRCCTGSRALNASRLAAKPGNPRVRRRAVFDVTAEPGDLLSTAQMLVATNDGFGGLQPVALLDGETPLAQTIELNAYDTGAEENTRVHQGFEGGQPDPSRGTENIENGTPPPSRSVGWTSSAARRPPPPSSRSRPW